MTKTCRWCHHILFDADNKNIIFCNKTCFMKFVRRRSEISRRYPYGKEQFEALESFKKLGIDYHER
jgi:hypothetical protein